MLFLGVEVHPIWLDGNYGYYKDMVCDFETGK